MDYPPGVTGKMIDSLDNQCCCDNCRYYYHGTCDIADRPYTADEIDSMSDDDYSLLVEREPDDYCEQWEGEEE